MTDPVSKHKGARPPVEYTKQRRTIPCPKCGGRMDRGAKSQCRPCLLWRPEIPQPIDPAKRNIALTRGLLVTVDASEYERLACDVWCAKLADDGKFYAVRS